MVPIRCGNWNNGLNAGPSAVNLNNPRSNSNTNIGARPDSESPRTRQLDGGAKGDTFRHLGAKSAFRRVSGRPVTSRFERQTVVLQ